MTYRVEILTSEYEDEEGYLHQTWGLAARRGPKMGNGPAKGISAEEAISLVHALERIGSIARIRKSVALKRRRAHRAKGHI